MTVKTSDRGPDANKVLFVRLRTFIDLNIERRAILINYTKQKQSEILIQNKGSEILKTVVYLL